MNEMISSQSVMTKHAKERETEMEIYILILYLHLINVISLQNVYINDYMNHNDIAMNKQ